MSEPSFALYSTVFDGKYSINFRLGGESCVLLCVPSIDTHKSIKLFWFLKDNFRSMWAKIIFRCAKMWLCRFFHLSVDFFSVVLFGFVFFQLRVNGKWFGMVFPVGFSSSLLLLFFLALYFGAVVSGAINKDKANAVKKSDKNKSIPKR